jgi:hypothetical protein
MINYTVKKVSDFPVPRKIGNLFLQCTYFMFTPVILGRQL